MAIGGYGRAEAYRSGNKVYGSGRNSPHMGTKLDPTGYIDRELKRKRLDKRSRLAATALSRLGQGHNWGRPDKKRNKKDANKSGSTRQFGNGPRTTPSSQAAAKNNGGPDGPPEFGQIGAESAGQEQGQFSPPKVDLNGKLIPMPWQMQMDWMNSATELAQQNASWDSEVGQAGVSLADTMRQLAQQKVVDKRNIAGNNASRGMSFSSGNAQDITENEANYAEADASANNWYNNIVGEIGQGGTQRALAQSSFDQYATMLQAEAARRLAERAGTLGFGQDNTTKGGGGKTGGKTGGKDGGKGGKKNDKKNRRKRRRN